MGSKPLSHFRVAEAHKRWPPGLFVEDKVLILFNGPLTDSDVVILQCFAEAFAYPVELRSWPM